MKTVLTILLALLSMTINGQTYETIWNQADEAAKNDLPRTQYDVLMKIVAKAQREQQYGQLMAAELAGSRVMADISPDSLQPAVERMEQRRRQAKDTALATVYAVVLNKIYKENRRLEKPEGLTVTLDPETCERLAAVQATAYKPLTVEGRDSRWFDDDMLSVVGYELQDFGALNTYYNKVGNRVASMMTALELTRQGKQYGKSELEAYLTKLDSLIALYGDLPECGEVAIERYDCLEEYVNRYARERSEETLWNYLQEAQQRWGSYERMSQLLNAQQQLTRPRFYASLYKKLAMPDEQQKLEVINIKNLSQLTLRVYRVKVDGNTQLNASDEKDYRKLKALATELPELRVTRTYSGKPVYETFGDSIPLPGLPVGVYMLEMESQPATEVSRQLYFVSNVRTLVEPQPDNRQRYVVVDAVEGQPVKGATIELRDYRGERGQKLATLTTDANGEAVYHYAKNRPTYIYSYTDADKACLPMNSYGNFYYNDSQRHVERTHLFTDRAIYRPGQTVRVATIVYEVEHGFEQKALENRKVRLTLRDANGKVVSEQTLTTDRYGSCAADFTLPSSGLTGQYTIQAATTSRNIRVEEYKRPTFEVTFDEVVADYKDGDTVTVSGTARSYAGVPVQGAKVKYSVERRASRWWWVDVDEEAVAEGEAVTGSDGKFTVAMPMVLPKTEFPAFYSFVCTADVTDQAGETHQGVTSLPLGNRTTAFSVDVPEQVRADEGGKMTFELRNAAGNPIDATAKYRIDGRKWLSAKTNAPLALPKLVSGSHTLEAVCAEDTVKQSFVVFSLDDKRPATETDGWFYQSATQFPNDGTPVTVQVGSSAKNVHIVYSIISGNRVIESGAVDRNNELINRKFTYKEEYGNGLVLTYAWVKQGKSHTYTAKVMRPLPDKRLKLEWQTFRDRLTPGQQEEWRLTVKAPDGTPADALLMATLYDKSLDQIARHSWSFSPYQSISLPSVNWRYGSWGGGALTGEQRLKLLDVKSISLTHFDDDLFPHYWRSGGRMLLMSRNGAVAKSSAGVFDSVEESAAAPAAVARNEIYVSSQKAAGDQAIGSFDVGADTVVAGNAADEQQPDIPLRENLQETAFFYPQLQTDSTGMVTLKFTLPESLTTWRFMGLAHTADLCHGLLTGETVAKKDLMVQPNMPRFVREGDRATISARIIDTCERDLSGTAWLTLIDPETEQTVYTTKTAFEVKAGETTSVTFAVSPTADYPSLLIAKVSATGDGFSDGEQHYLPVLSNRERVTVTLPFTQNEPGTKTIDLTKLVPADVKNAKMTFEYTNNPAWLMIQALPDVGHPYDDCAICQAASLYANTIGKHIVDQVPQAKTVFEQWKREQGSETTLSSQLEKNQELKDLVLNETPWVADADRESEQRQRLADFFDENLMQQRLQSAIDKLTKLQRGDGSWSWWPEMPGSVYMTIAVAEMMVRQNVMVGEQSETKKMLTSAFKFLGKEMVQLVKEMKRDRKKGHKPYFPGNNALQWLYICKLDGRQLPTDVQEANEYLVRLLKKETKNQTIYQKALSAIILDSPLYIKSLKEYTVYKEETGRYYDTPRAGYSWRDYRIPTQVAAIEAIQRLTPADQQTLDEMRRWLLQQKRTQAWDTPLNSVDAVYAFLSDKGKVISDKFPTGVPKESDEGMAVANSSLFTSHFSLLSLDDKTLDTSAATAGIGYVKTTQPYAGEKTFTAQKTSEGTSWGAVYAQFMQPTSDISDQASDVSVKREILKAEADSHLSSLNSHLSVGDRIIVRLTIQSERDLDFVQLQDKRAACMEPVRQLSGYDWRGGYYMTPRDNVTNYYFDRLPKGKHVIETEYYIDRVGEYETGTCTVQCAYASEYRGTTHSQTIEVDNTSRSVSVVNDSVSFSPAEVQNLTVDKPTVDVGRTGYEMPVTATFELCNQSQQKLQIESVRPDCNCTKVEFPKEEIGAGDKFTVRMTYDARQLGHFNKQAAIFTNGSKKPVYITMTGVVLADMRDWSGSYPYDYNGLLGMANNLEFDNVNKGEQRTYELHIMNNGTQPMQPNVLHLPSYLSAKAYPELLKPGQHGKMVFTLHSEKIRDYGLTQTSVYLAQELGESVKPSTEIPVSAVLLPPVVPMANAPVLALSKTTLNLTFGKKSKATGEILLTNTGRSRLDITSLQMFTRGLNVTLGKSRLMPGESTRLKITGVAAELSQVRSVPRVLMITNDPKRSKVIVTVHTH